MRRVLTCGALAVVLSACSVVAPEYRPTPTPTPSATVVAKPDILPITYTVTPLDVRPNAVAKTGIFFSNPNSFVLDWFMTVRFRSADGQNVTNERIGNAGVPPDRVDAKFQNWYFPIPPGESWTVVRYSTAFAKSDVQEFKVARSLILIGEVEGVRVSEQACAGDPVVKTIGCDFTVETSTTVPRFSKLHLVVVVRTKSVERPVLSLLQWRPDLELAATGKPWLNLVAGEPMKIKMYDSYPTPSVPWDYEVFVHAYQYSSQ